MKKKAFEIENKVSYDFWWFYGRRLLFLYFLKKKVSKNSRILDLGCSTGNNLKMLKLNGYKNFEGVDSNKIAIDSCKRNGFKKVRKADLCKLPFRKSSTDFILATDVIEHIDNDVEAVKEIKRILKKNHHAIITVPAFNFLWSNHDEIAEHKRRYTKKELLHILQINNLKIEEIFYFNYILFVPIILVRIFLRLFNIKYESDNNINTNLLNKVLKKVFLFDIKTARILKPFFGVSIFALIRK
tara:strand:+ start:124 stop:849 length:726 start_codon:yes stop_codon:yes gene_type:complete